MLRLLKKIGRSIGVTRFIVWLKLYGRRYKNFYNESINL